MFEKSCLLGLGKNKINNEKFLKKALNVVNKNKCDVGIALWPSIFISHFKGLMKPLGIEENAEGMKVL